MMIKRVFLIIADSFGIGLAPDAAVFGDEGANTLASCENSGKLVVPTLQSMGLFNIDDITVGTPAPSPIASYARMREASAGKDTTIGHWELCGLHSQTPLPTYPNGFPQEVIDRLKAAFGREIICNLPYSGTEVIKDYGEEHVNTGALIVYTSADSVLQIAAHEEVVPLEMLYHYCEQARDIMQGKHGVGRVIARPFIGDPEHGFTRTSHRHDYSLTPPASTLLDAIKAQGMDVIAVGKIFDIFAGVGITDSVRTENNADGLAKTLEFTKRDFHGLCFINLVDFDMVYGHRRDVDGYTAALNEMDAALPAVIDALTDEDVLILTADHGCDPAYRGTDHTRETVPMLIYGKALRSGVNLGIRDTFADVSATIASLLGVNAPTNGTSFAKELTT